MTEKTIVFQPMGRRVRLDKSANVLELAGRCGVKIEAVCGGKGQCGKCKVRVWGKASPPGERERELLGPELDEGFRLACQAGLKESAVVWVPETSRLGVQKILTAGYELDMDFNPAVKSFELEVPKPDLSAVIADRERALAQLSRVSDINPQPAWRTPVSVLRGLEHKLVRESGRITTVVTTSGRVMDFSPDWDLDCLGLAVDLGTTTIVAYLTDLKTGEILSVEADMNPQVSQGEDVISRIFMCQKDPDQLRRLAGLARGRVNELIRAACREADVDPARIFECVVVGNTAMIHIFMELSPCNLAHAPYTPVASSDLEVSATELGLDIAPEARVITLPLKAGFVGADTVAVALALGADRVNEPTLMVDLGTNGEIALASPDDILCCSTAAGPAFEGGHVRWGMRGASGAVDSVKISGPDLSPELTVIGGGPPLGICGSGLVSVISELVKAGVIKRSGGFNRDLSSPRLRKGPDGMEYIIAAAEDSGMGEDLVVTHRDVSELQLAKAAIHAGISLMMAELGVVRISQVLLAGAFGNYLDPVAACGINMFPGVDPSIVTGVGNAAGVGAAMALLSRKERERSRSLAERMRYMELAAHPRFSAAFVDGMAFTP